MTRAEVWYFASLFGSVGVLLLAIAILLLIRTRAFLRRAHDAKAIVIRLVRKDDGHWATWAPVYQFRTRDGQTIEVEDTLSSQPPMFVENQVVDVFYDPAAPHDARARRPLHQLPLVLGGLGVSLLGLAFAVLLLLRTIPHQAEP